MTMILGEMLLLAQAKVFFSASKLLILAVLFSWKQIRQPTGTMINDDSTACFQVPTSSEVSLELVCSLDSTNSRSCTFPGVWRSNFVLCGVRLDWDTTLQMAHNSLLPYISNNFTLHC